MEKTGYWASLLTYFFCFASRGLDHHVKFFKMPRLMLECLRLMMLTSLRNPTQTLNKLGFIFTKYPDTYYNSKSFRRISGLINTQEKKGREVEPF